MTFEEWRLTHTIDTVTLKDAWNFQQERIEELKKEINNLYNGNKGACFACEPVEELNQELTKEIERLTGTLQRSI